MIDALKKNNVSIALPYEFYVKGYKSNLTTSFVVMLEPADKQASATIFNPYNSDVNDLL